jgi:hypothetical protein
VRVIDEESFKTHLDYIDRNPVKAGLATSLQEYPYGWAYLKKQKSMGLKPDEIK